MAIRERIQPEQISLFLCLTKLFDVFSKGKEEQHLLNVAAGQKGWQKSTARAEELQRPGLGPSSPGRTLKLSGAGGSQQLLPPPLREDERGKKRP